VAQRRGPLSASPAANRAPSRGSRSRPEGEEPPPLPPQGAPPLR